MRRRQFLLSCLTATGGVLAASSVASCSQTTASPPPGAAGSASPTVPGGTFPTDVTHRYGTTTIPHAPTRVITLGQTDHDPAIALGVTPVAVAGFLGGTYSPVRPWNTHGFGGEKPTVLDMQKIDFEKVAALAPDLILAVMSGITADDFAKLSAICPTVAQPVDYEDWAVPVKPHTELVGAALGQRDAAQKLLDDLDAAFTKAQQDNPSLVGKRAICAEKWAADFTVLGTGAPRTAFLTDLGMVLPDSLTALAGKGYNAPLSAEKVDLLDDLDVVVWTTDVEQTKALLSDKLVATLRTTKEQRYVLAPNGGNDDLLYSMDWGSILSNGWALEHATPRLVAAVDGSLATDPNR